MTPVPAEIGRLKKRPEFLRVAATQRKAVTASLILQAGPATGKEKETSPRADTQETRIGFTASRKVGGAVQRNRAKRRLRAAAAKILPFHAKGGYDLVLIARPATLSRPFQGILNDLESALRKLGLYRDE